MTNPWNEFRRQYKGQGIPAKKLAEMYRAQKDKRAKNSDVRKRLAEENEGEVVRQHARIQTLQSDLEKCRRDLTVATDQLVIMKEAAVERSGTRMSSRTIRGSRRTV